MPWSLTRDGAQLQIAVSQLSLVVVPRVQNYVANDQDVIPISAIIVKHAGILIKHATLLEPNGLSTTNVVRLSVLVRPIHSIVRILNASKVKTECYIYMYLT